MMRIPNFRRKFSVRSTPGFTLVEILVVLGIVGLLAAILFPVFIQARDGTRRVSCASNLRQIGQAMQLYVSDHNRCYPLAPPTADSCSWADRVYPYVKSPHVFECPALPDAEFQPGCVAPRKVDDALVDPNGGYSINTLEDATWMIGRSKLNEARLMSPSGTILVVDGGGVVSWVNPGVNNPMTGPEELKAGGIPDRHRGGDNALFCDGHVKWLSLQTLTKRSLWRADGAEPPPTPSPPTPP